MKPTDALNSSLIGITTPHVWGSLSAHRQEFLDVHRHWYIFTDLMTICDQEQDGTAVPSRSWSQTIIKSAKMYQCRCTAKNFWWWAERLPQTCRVVIPIKLEFSASVGFIH